MFLYASKLKGNNIDKFFDSIDGKDCSPKGMGLDPFGEGAKEPWKEKYRNKYLDGFSGWVKCVRRRCSRCISSAAL